jgi:hypothetical protein
MFEIASAEEQIALFKLITDKVWQSLADEKRKQDEQAAEQRRRAAMSGGGRAKRSSAQPKPIKPVPVAPPPKPQPIQPPSTQPITPMSFANDKSMQTMAQQSDGLADERIAAYPQISQQTAILPKRLR